MTNKANIAVILSGCGNKDGGEIHESVTTLLAIHKAGADFQCFAPNIRQHHVLNFITGEEMKEERNVLVESARIARGNIKDLALFNADEYDALIIPGGLGVVKNLSTFAFDGPDFSVNEEVKRAILEMNAKSKPIGTLCIAPILLAKLLGDVSITLGPEGGAADAAQTLGATHTATTHGEIVVDERNKLVSTPCYMLDASVDQIAAGAEKLVRAVLDLIE